MRNFWRQVRALVEGFAPRERLLLLFAGALLGTILIWAVVVTPVTAGIERAELRAETAERNLTTAMRLSRELRQIQQPLSEAERRIREQPSTNLFTTLEALARQSAIQVNSMEPQTGMSSDRYQETKVQVVLKNVSLAQVVNYLHRIESSPQLLSIKSMRVRTQPAQPDLLDVTFTVSSFETR